MKTVQSKKAGISPKVDDPKVHNSQGVERKFHASISWRFSIFIVLIGYCVLLSELQAGEGSAQNESANEMDKQTQPAKTKTMLPAKILVTSATLITLAEDQKLRASEAQQVIETQETGKSKLRDLVDQDHNADASEKTFVISGKNSVASKKENPKKTIIIEPSRYRAVGYLGEKLSGLGEEPSEEEALSARKVLLQFCGEERLSVELEQAAQKGNSPALRGLGGERLGNYRRQIMQKAVTRVLNNFREQRAELPQQDANAVLRIAKKTSTKSYGFFKKGRVLSRKSRAVDAFDFWRFVFRGASTAEDKDSATTAYNELKQRFGQSPRYFQFLENKRQQVLQLR